ncbi:MAG: M1 family metallopeptidase [Longilinea sp.]|nr:M1 family metallopeptidase [Longilinea sp.]
MKRVWRILWLSALLLGACTQTPPPADPTLPASTEAAPTVDFIETPTLEPTALPSVTPAAPQPITYTLNVQWDFGYRQVVVQQDIGYTNNSTEPITQLVLMAEPNRWKGAFELEALTGADGQNYPNAVLDSNQLTIPLDTPLMPGQRIALQAHYTIVLPEIPPPSESYRPVPFGYTVNQSNLVDWYLYFPPYEAGRGWLAHPAWYYGEHQVYELADFDITLDVSNAPEGLVLAASSPAEQDGSRYHYTLKDCRSFAISGSPVYTVFEKQVGNITVLSYSLFPFSHPAAEAALEATSEAVSLYGELFTPYTRTTLSVVEADFLDGMEYDGLYFLSRGFYSLYEGTDRGYLTMIAVHETSHQWWFGSVGNDQGLEPWLDESLATYCERLYYEQSGPEAVNWWWAYRVDFYNPAGWINRGIYDYGGYLPYRNAVYLRGAQFFEDLRTAMGDEAFFAFLKDYAETLQNQTADREAFFEIAARHTDADLSSLLAEYFMP